MMFAKFQILNISSRLRRTTRAIPLLLNTNYSKNWSVRTSTKPESIAYTSKHVGFSSEKSFLERLNSQFRESIFSLVNILTEQPNSSSVANLFANGWVVDNKTQCEFEPSNCSDQQSKQDDLHLIVEYSPQKIYLTLACSRPLSYLCVHS